MIIRKCDDCCVTSTKDNDKVKSFIYRRALWQGMRDSEMRVRQDTSEYKKGRFIIARNRHREQDRLTCDMVRKS
jgi:hypothetical protein